MIPRHASAARFVLWRGACLFLFIFLSASTFVASQRAQAYSPPTLPNTSLNDVPAGTLPCSLPDEQLVVSTAWGGMMSDMERIGDDLFVSMDDRVAKLDATSPNNVQVAQYSFSVGSKIKDIAASGDFLFVAGGKSGALITTHGLNVFSAITIPDAPEALDVQQVVVSGRRLYVVLNSTQVYIYEISQPQQPRYISRYVASSPIKQLVANENSLFLKVGFLSSHEVEMVDIRSPESPTLIWTISSITGEMATMGDFLFALQNDTINVYDTANGGPPGLFASLPTHKHDWLAMVVRGTYLYLLNNDSILTLDASTPYKPRIVGWPNLIEPNLAVSAGMSVNIEDMVIFNNGFRLYFYDASEAATPRPLGSSAPPVAINSLAFENDRLYFSSPYQYTVLDVSNPIIPQKIEAVPLADVDSMAPFGRYVAFADITPQLSVVDSRDWTVVGQERSSMGRLYEMKVIGTRLYGLGGNFSIFDLANPASPVELGGLDLESDETDQKMAIFSNSNVGNFAYLMDSARRLTVIDMGDPAHPTIAATVTMTETTGLPVALEVVNGHLLIVTSNELLIAELNDPLAPQVVDALTFDALPLVDESVISAFVLDGTRGYVFMLNGRIEIVEFGDLTQMRHLENFSVTPSLVPLPLNANNVVDAVVGGDQLYAANDAGSIVQLQRSASASMSFDLSQSLSANLEFSPCAPITISFDPTQIEINKRASIRANAEVTPTLSVTYRQLNRHYFGAFLPELDLLSPFEVAVLDEDGIALDGSLPVTLTVRYGTPGSGAPAQGVKLYGWVEDEWEPVATSVNDSQNATLVAAIPLQTPLRLVTNAPQLAGERTLLPSVPNHMPDVRITAFEATQGVQSVNNGVPLVAGRATTLRLYAETQNEFAINDFVLTLSATRNGTLLDPAVITVGPRAIFPVRDRASHNTSFETPLPLSWTEGNVSLRATLTHINGDYRGSTRTTTLYFYQVPPLDLTLVPIVVNRAGPSLEFVSDHIMQLFPLSEVRVTLHAPYFYDFPLKSADDWVNLLSEIATMRYLENADENAIYFGFIDPSTNESSIGGVGYTDIPASIGLNVGYIGAHEVGHNLGRLHSPCGNPDYLDFSYPYPDGSIGEYGYSLRTGEILTPNAYVDVMSYCLPSWISDYTYSGIFFTHRHAWQAAASAADEQMEPLLMVRANVQASGSDGAQNATLLPTYRFEGKPTPLASISDYAIRLLDANQAILATHAVTLHVAQEPGVTVQSIHSLLPLPEADVAIVQLLYQDAIIATRAVGRSSGMNEASTAVATQLTLSNDTLTATWQGEVTNAMPALIRYLPDDSNGQPLVLGIDITSGTVKMTTSHLPGGGGRVEVILADQPLAVASASSPSAALQLPDKPPTLWVTGPNTVSADQPLILFGHAYDVEDGVTEELQWLWEGQTIAVGPTLHLLADQLPATVGNEMVFSLEATDSAGNRSTIPVPIYKE